jgi:hypothetical protein
LKKDKRMKKTKLKVKPLVETYNDSTSFRLIYQRVRGAVTSTYSPDFTSIIERYSVVLVGL